jgi:poly(3-hydroxybutyrate) depolymerase
MKEIKFDDMTPAERQAWADFQLKESYRHLDDIEKIDENLKKLKLKYGIVPRKIFINTRIEQ